MEVREALEVLELHSWFLKYRTSAYKMHMEEQSDGNNG